MSGPTAFSLRFSCMSFACGCVEFYTFICQIGLCMCQYRAGTCMRQYSAGTCMRWYSAGTGDSTVPLSLLLVGVQPLYLPRPSTAVCAATNLSSMAFHPVCPGLTTFSEVLTPSPHCILVSAHCTPMRRMFSRHGTSVKPDFLGHRSWPRHIAARNKRMAGSQVGVSSPESTLSFVSLCEENDTSCVVSSRFSPSTHTDC